MFVIVTHAKMLSRMVNISNEDYYHVLIHFKHTSTQITNLSNMYLEASITFEYLENIGWTDCKSVKELDWTRFKC